MPFCETKFHGAMEYEAGQVLRLAAGLFGFARETEFLLLEVPSLRPLVFLQSIGTPGLCFLGIPAQVVDKDYVLTLGAQELKDLGLPEGEQPEMGKDLLCIALLSTEGKSGTTANLQAPVVIHIERHSGVQAMAGGTYSHQQPFATEALSLAC